MAASNKNTAIHPGVHVRHSILPAGLSVKEAAEMLGVGRPALSSLLNGRAALSPDMAVRLERAFGADARALLELQTQWDEEQARSRENDIPVRRYVHASYQVRASDIEAWADTEAARAQLAALLRALVHSTADKLKAVDFPAFDNSQRKGWDGKVTSESVTPWIPRGTSGWEFGCSKRPQTKAESDYGARTTGVPSAVRRTTTFVFVTPRNWPGKNRWAEGKRQLGGWKDVRVLDASDLEQWLEQSLPGQLRLLEFLHRAAPDVKTLDAIWSEWALVTEPELPRDLFTSAVERHKERLEKWLDSPPDRLFVVTADSTLEALAFLSCTLKHLDDPCSGAYGRAVVVRSPGALRTVDRGAGNSIAIVDSTEAERELAGLQRRVHTITVCGSNTAAATDADISLGLLSHDSFRQALRRTGFTDKRIEQLARSSARSPTILRRLLATVEAVKNPPWASDSAVVGSLAPLMLLGAWDSSVPADREVLMYLSGESYDDVETAIAQLQTVDQSPVWSRGDLRGVVSKFDALEATHRLFTRQTLDKFLFLAEVVLSDEDPAMESPGSVQWAASLFGKSRHHSPVLRRSIGDSLVLLAVHGNRLFRDRLGLDLEHGVSRVVRNLLTPSDGLTWLSQKDDLPRYAEAAPDAFLRVIEEDLDNEEQVASLLAPADSGPFGDCPRTGLLSALELLAWKPERLSRVVDVLVRLCAWPLDDNWLNRPSRTLEAIFRPWLPQTAASVGERHRALQRLVRKFPDVGWQVCVAQFAPGGRAMDRSSRPRWRPDAQEAAGMTRAEADKGCRDAIELALSWPKHDEHTLGDLVERLGELGPDRRDRVWRLVGSWSKTDPDDCRKAALRERIRCGLLSRLGRYRGTDSIDRKRARRMYDLLEPGDPLLRHQWLFMSVWPEEPIPEQVEQQPSVQEVERRVACQRRDAVQEVWAKSGQAGIHALCHVAEVPGVVGHHMAEVCVGVGSAVEFVDGVLAERNGCMQEAFKACIGGFLVGLETQDRESVLEELLDRVSSDEQAAVDLLCVAPFDAIPDSRKISGS